MNAITMARMAYSSVASPTRSQQGIEYQAFARVTGRIRMAAAQEETSFADLAAALHENRRLWLLLATDVVDAGNGLPDQLRAQIMYLAEFTTHHTGKVLNGSATVDALIDVNTAVMRGLRMQEAGG